MATKRRATVIPPDTQIREVEFGARKWRVLLIRSRERVGPLYKNRLGFIDPDNNLIYIRSLHPDTDTISFLHEGLHWAFPDSSFLRFLEMGEAGGREDSKQFLNAIEDVIDSGAERMKNYLEAFGVDTSKWKKGFKP